MDYAVADEIAALLDYRFDITVVDSTDSTNKVLKVNSANCRAGTVLIAHSQTDGRGRLGRSFVSQRGGLYLSLLLKPNISPAEACLYTPIAALAIAEAVDAVLGIQLEIKWVNDLFYKGKKVCGVLTEAAPKSNSFGLDYVVIGIGLNVYEPELGFGAELDKIAIALLPASGQKSGTINNLAAETVKRICKYTSDFRNENYYRKYKSRLFVLGRDVIVHQANRSYKATVIDLNRDYTLLIEDENRTRHSLLSGEVSLKDFN